MRRDSYGLTLALIRDSLFLLNRLRRHKTPPAGWQAPHSIPSGTWGYEIMVHISIRQGPMPPAAQIGLTEPSVARPLLMRPRRGSPAAGRVLLLIGLALLPEIWSQARKLLPPGRGVPRLPARDVPRLPPPRD